MSKPKKITLEDAKQIWGVMLEENRLLGRMYGYNQAISDMAAHKANKKKIKPDTVKLQSRVNELLAAIGIAEQYIHDLTERVDKLEMSDKKHFDVEIKINDRLTNQVDMMKVITEKWDKIQKDINLHYTQIGAIHAGHTDWQQSVIKDGDSINIEKSITHPFTSASKTIIHKAK